MSSSSPDAATTNIHEVKQDDPYKNALTNYFTLLGELKASARTVEERNAIAEFEVRNRVVRSTNLTDFAKFYSGNSKLKEEAMPTFRDIIANARMDALISKASQTTSE
jgi:hypothetical protein